VVVTTKRRKDGYKFTGGVSRYRRIKTDLLALLRDTDARVTTMLDYYGLPKDFPGQESRADGNVQQRVQHLEDALAVDIGDQRLLPYLSLHEFEALVFAGLTHLARVYPGSNKGVEMLKREVGRFSSPEEINDGPTTHPGARLVQRIPGYDKPLHGPQVVAEIGLPTLRARCPHFDHWITILENLD
jgi:hypothetical protein